MKKMKIEKVEYQINWKKFKLGWSFFIPCLDAKAAQKRVKKEVRRFKYKTVSKVTIEEGVRGVRVWRV
jgi:hypothetical protein